MNRSIATSDLRRDISIGSTLPRHNGGIRDFMRVLLRTPSLCKSKHKNRANQKSFAVIPDEITEELKTEIIDDELLKLNTPKKQTTSYGEHSISPITGEIDTDKVSLNGSSSIFHSTFNYPLHSTLLFEEDFPDVVVCSSPPIKKTSAPRLLRILKNSEEEHNRLKHQIRSNVIRDPLNGSNENFISNNFKSLTKSSPTCRLQSDDVRSNLRNSYSSAKEHLSVRTDRLSRQGGCQRRTKRIKKDFYRFIGQYIESSGSYCFSHSNEFNSSVQCLEL